MSRGALVRLFHGSCGVLILLSSAAAQDPVYRAGFITSLDRTPYYLAPDGAAPGLAITEGICVPRIDALPGRLRTIPVWSTLTTPSVSPLERIHGWSISLRAEGARILFADSMFAGKAAEFERTEVTSGAGNEGVVSTVILSSGFPGDTAVSGGTFPIASVSVEVTVPSEGCAETTLRYEDGLLDSKGRPIANRILSIAPTSLELEACSTSICAIPANTEICNNARDDDGDAKVDMNDTDCANFPSEGCSFTDCGCSPSFDVFFTNEKTQRKPPPGSTLTLSSRQATLAITNSVALAGFELSGRTLPGEGGFTLELTGDVADEKGRNVRNVFLDALGNRISPSVLNVLSTPHGHIAAVERSPDLEPFDATSFLTFDFESGPSGSSFWVRYLADPASPVALIPPHTGSRCANNRILTVTFGPPFHRGDANGDGILDLADPVAVLLRLFGAGDPLACLEAANSNDDGALNVADPVHILNHLFLGGPAPPDPGPPGTPCGVDGALSQSFLGCDAYVGCGG